MCDRSKAEILARSFCIEIWWWKVYDDTRDIDYRNVEHFTEDNWESFMPKAKQLLETLEKHE